MVWEFNPPTTHIHQNNVTELAITGNLKNYFMLHYISEVFSLIEHLFLLLLLWSRQGKEGGNRSSQKKNFQFPGSFQLPAQVADSKTGRGVLLCKSLSVQPWARNGLEK